MGRMISTVDTTLRIPKNFKGLTGKEPLEIELKKEVPTEVSDKILKYYTTNRPHVFRKEGEPEPEIPQGGNIDDLPPKFNPLDFLTEHHENFEAGLETLENPIRPKLFEIANMLKLKDFAKQSNERIKERIVLDIKAKKDQADKVGKDPNEK